ncbi:MAG: M28 family peptidase [Novosphingobium sp.]|nr:M28 family peptidase [Novosphingobium sp.]
MALPRCGARLWGGALRYSLPDVRAPRQQAPDQASGVGRLLRNARARATAPRFRAESTRAHGGLPPVRRRRPAAACLALVALAAAAPATASDPKRPGGVAYDIVAGLTTEVGPRLDGSEAEARARAWAVARLQALGFANVHVEPFTIRGFVRGTDEARLTAPVPQRLVITALGYSAPTPARGIEGEVAYFPTLDALKSAPDGALAGKIVFIDHAMRANQDGSGYGLNVTVRRQGPTIASRKGAIGVVIRSIGTDNHRLAHAGVTDWGKDARPIPAGAVSNPDADLIARNAALGRPMRIALTLTSHPQPNLPSGNVIGEIPGRDPSLPAVLAACHLDSWDLGTGAIDNAAGCGIITAAALQVRAAGQPLRTIRVLWAGSEELGGAAGLGGEEYAKVHAREPHAVAMESDFGADRVWRVQFDITAAGKPLADRIAAALSPMGIVRGAGKASGGEDITPVAQKQKIAVIALSQDGTRYFDIHHTADDTLDKIDPAQLQQNVDVWATVLGIVANEPGPIPGSGG